MKQPLVLISVIVSACLCFLVGCGERDNMKMESAIEEYSKAIEKNQNDPFLYGMRARLYSKVGQNDKAIRDFTAAISIDSTQPEFNCFLTPWLCTPFN